MMELDQVNLMTVQNLPCSP